ncbi:AraC family transcriptional regulator [Sphingobacterium sp. DR205]|uniref:AraC family transcriptional regulator n=1 Tax=Sphingobacterium sp. DR205 TaxID=2713573 RepID=UPI0013E4F395|nr:AraC family transcriptional regulator [Sphingobacterium sp. DR205]QIH34424.1 helix-turn-helix transcriptional regulator [Sphingobacterium sp. DR205]
MKKNSIFGHLRESIKLLRRLSMTKPETLEEYYARHEFVKSFDLNSPQGHFNIFEIKELSPQYAKPVTYGRKDYFKICVVSGKSKIHYADKSFEIMENGLLFATPSIPYDWEPLDVKQFGFSCIFTESFFNEFGNIKKYPVFQPGGFPVYELTSNEKNSLIQICAQIMKEQKSNFEYKNDSIRSHILQLIHSAMKMRPSTYFLPEKNNAAKRLTTLFLDLLENQFPIQNTMDGLRLRSASEFADQMAVHVNHLNKSVKDTTQKTTSDLISDRILREAKIMLKHSSWAISEIAYSLGFEGPSHFSTFFKKRQHISPSQFRSMI